MTHISGDKQPRAHLVVRFTTLALAQRIYLSKCGMTPHLGVIGLAAPVPIEGDDTSRKSSAPFRSVFKTKSLEWFFQVRIPKRSID